MSRLTLILAEMALERRLRTSISFRNMSSFWRDEARAEIAAIREIRAFRRRCAE